MKAEHRRELRTNTLAEGLGRAFQGVKEGPSRGTLLVGGLAVLALVVFGTWRYLSNSSEKDSSAAWIRWDEANSREALEKFAETRDAQGTIQGRLARFQLARANLQEGLRDLAGSLREKAREKIQKAAETYEKLSTESTGTPILQQEALLGAAQAYESLFDVARARSFYEKLAHDFPQTTLGKDAARQLERLNDEEANKDIQELKREYGAPANSSGTNK